MVIFFIFKMHCVYGQSNNWWIFFNDKCTDSISLSEKSIERRHSNGIEFDQFDYPVCSSYIDSLNKNHLSIRNISRWLNAVSISVDSLQVLESILAYNFVKEIKPVQTLLKNSHDDIINFKYDSDHFLKQTPLLYGYSYNQLDMLGGVDLHNEGFLGDDILIAVFDAGFEGVESLPIFDNLWSNNQILDTYDFVDNDINVFHGSSHGTMVLSTMGGYMPDSLIGTAPNANFMLFKTEDSSSETLVEEDNWAAAAEYADSIGVDIINSSLGYTILYDDTLNSHSYSDMDGNSTIITNAADLAASRGILVINSAGNSAGNDWYYIGAPADGDSVLAVGAVNAQGNIASFSSRGPSYDGRVKPNVCAQGVQAVVADLDSTIRVANGTSFSAPILAGLAACLWQTNTDLTNMDILNMIEESAHLFSNPNDSLGYGIPNLHQAYLNSLSANVELNNINIYPNPFHDIFHIKNSSNEDISVDIFNIMGTLIYSKSISKNNPLFLIDDLSYYPTGVFFIKINDVNTYQIIKL